MTADAGPIADLATSLEAHDYSVSRGVEVGGETAVVARRARWAATARLHTFILVFEIQELTIDAIENASSAALDYSIRTKGGLPRGLQTGTFTFATFVGQTPEKVIRDWFLREHTHRRAAMQLPLLADLESGNLVSYSGRLSKGSAFQPICDEVRRQVAAGLGCRVR